MKFCRGKADPCCFLNTGLEHKSGFGLLSDGKNELWSSPARNMTCCVVGIHLVMEAELHMLNK